MPKQKSTAEKPAKATAAKSAEKKVTPEKRPAAQKPVRTAESAHAASAHADASVSLSADEMHRLIQEAAYFKAKARNFAPGHEVQDWIEAESEVRLRFDAGTRGVGRSA